MNDTRSLHKAIDALSVIDTIYMVLWFAACFAAAFFLAFLVIWIFNRLPAKWLCDYGETPSDELLFEDRLYRRTHFPLLFLTLSLLFLASYWQFGGSLYFLFAVLLDLIMVMVVIADSKYTIIPDQFTLAFLALAVLFLCYDGLWGQKLLSSSMFSLLLGAACGGGAMLLLGLAGKLFYKKDGIGFGDVKLFAVIGLFTGFPMVFAVVFLSILLAGIHYSYLLLRGKTNSKAYLPLGPYIGAAFLVYLNAYTPVHRLIGWYASLFTF